MPKGISGGHEFVGVIVGVIFSDKKKANPKVGLSL
jgi:hypothetical protein